MTTVHKAEGMTLNKVVNNPESILYVIVECICEHYGHPISL